MDRLMYQISPSHINTTALSNVGEKYNVYNTQHTTNLIFGSNQNFNNNCWNIKWKYQNRTQKKSLLSNDN